MAGKPRKSDQWPLVDAVKMRIKQTGGAPQLALHDLEDALAGGKLRSTRRDVATGKQVPVLPAFWRACYIRYDDHGAITIYGLRKGEPRPLGTFSDPDHNQDRIDGYVYFVSRADYDRLFFALDAQEATETTERRKPGRRSTHNWPLHVAVELHRIVEVEKKPVPPASYLAQLCGEKLGYMPDIRAVQRLLKTLLG